MRSDVGRRRGVLAIMLLNRGYFFVEFAVGDPERS